MVVIDETMDHERDEEMLLLRCGFLHANNSQWLYVVLNRVVFSYASGSRWKEKDKETLDIKETEGLAGQDARKRERGGERETERVET